MNYLLKKTLVAVLRSLAIISDKVDSIYRLWANVRLNSALGVSVHPSIALVTFSEIILEGSMMIGEYYSIRHANHQRSAEGAAIGVNAVITKNIPATVAVGKS